MFEFAVLADSGGLAITLRALSGYAECGDGFFRQQRAQFLADVDQLGEVFDIAPRERVLDHGDRRRASRRRFDRAAAFLARLFEENRELADFRFHLRPSLALISEAFSPPARLWTRAPQVIASASSNSSARGASVRPTSMASKWLRT